MLVVRTGMDLTDQEWPLIEPLVSGGAPARWRRPPVARRGALSALSGFPLLSDVQHCSEVLAMPVV
jgi:hypothetical protein